MPYIQSEKVAAMRNEIRKQFPSKNGYKISVRREHGSMVYVTIQAAPIDLGSAIKEKYSHGEGYAQINVYYIDSHFEKHPEAKKFLSKIYSIINQGNGTEVIDGDYGNVPNFYTRINVGEWDKPFVNTSKKQSS